ncbi:hypothetical protein WJX84_001553, partial [Apatococcus fuscideae]
MQSRGKLLSLLDSAGHGPCGATSFRKLCHSIYTAHNPLAKITPSVQPHPQIVIQAATCAIQGSGVAAADEEDARVEVVFAGSQAHNVQLEGLIDDLRAELKESKDRLGESGEQWRRQRQQMLAQLQEAGRQLQQTAER